MTDDAPLVDLAEYRRQREAFVSTEPSQLEKMAEELLADVRAGKVQGLILLVHMKTDEPYIWGGGNLTCAEALWLSDMLRRKITRA